MHIRHYISLATAMIVLIGGMIIVIFAPGQLEGRYRVLIAVLVLFYFAFRVGQVVLGVQRDKRQSGLGLSNLIEPEEGREGRKTP